MHDKSHIHLHHQPTVEILENAIKKLAINRDKLFYMLLFLTQQVKTCPEVATKKKSEMVTRNMATSP